MVKLKHQFWLDIAFLILIPFLIWGCVTFSDSYMISKNVHAKVLGKYGEQYTRRKSSNIYTNFILVCKADNGQVFDTTVTPSTYHTYNEGSDIVFKELSTRKLRELTTFENICNLICIIITVFGTIALFIIIIIKGVVEIAQEY